ncbi:hypothetical protein AB5J72_29670 [Streptomyces sp. CG1]|uniref:hypothetical protein n=1 Tax=Streptomyces sp. CG1 TaxID=1287523 RepID=UPI0034E22E0B
MTNSLHEAMQRLFQQDPGLFAQAVKPLGLSVGDPLSASPFPAQQTERCPLEWRDRTLLRMDTAADGSFVLAVEALGEKSPDKVADWLHCLTYLSVEFSLPPVLLVVCQDRYSATWASQQFHVGPPQWPTFTLHLPVLGPDTVPVISTLDEASRDIPLAVLSASVHSRGPETGDVLKALALALKNLQAEDEDAATTFIRLAEKGLAETPAASLWRHLMAFDLPLRPTTDTLIPRPEQTPEALRAALAVVHPGRLEEMQVKRDEAFAKAVEWQSLSPVRGWVLTWARDIEIARRPDLSTRYAHAKDNLENEDPVVAQEALHELSAVLDEAMKEVRR